MSVPETPYTRDEMYLSAIADGDSSGIPDRPYTRKEKYLDAIATGDSSGIPETPYTREEMYLDAIAKNGGGGGGGGGGDYQKVTIFDLQGIELESDTDWHISAEVVIPGHYNLSTLQPIELVIIEMSGKYEGTAKTMGEMWLDEFNDDELVFDGSGTPLDGFNWRKIVVRFEMREETLWIVLDRGEEEEPFPASFTINIKVSKLVPVE